MEWTLVNRDLVSPNPEATELPIDPRPPTHGRAELIDKLKFAGCERDDRSSVVQTPVGSYEPDRVGRCRRPSPLSSLVHDIHESAMRTVCQRPATAISCDKASHVCATRSSTAVAAPAPSFPCPRQRSRAAAIRRAARPPASQRRGRSPSRRTSRPSRPRA